MWKTPIPRQHMKSELIKRLLRQDYTAAVALQVDVAPGPENPKLVKLGCPS